jgi:hypothetical protein
VNNQALNFAIRAIEFRLSESPNSADTVEGIHNYWIDWSEPVPPLLVTQQALEALEQKKLVEQVRVGERSIWRKSRPASTAQN